MRLRSGNRALLALLVLLAACCGVDRRCSGADAPATSSTDVPAAIQPLADWNKDSVHVTVGLIRGAGRSATLIGRFVPAAPDLHLYAVDLPADADGGVATRLDLPKGSPLQATGPLKVDVKSHEVDGLPVYPEGPVTVSLPVELPASADSAALEAAVVISYMACSHSFCKNPVIQQLLPFTLPAPAASPGPGSGPEPAVVAPAPPVAAPAPAPAPAPSPPGAPAPASSAATPSVPDQQALVALVRSAVAEAFARQALESGGVRWATPASLTDAQLLMHQAQEKGQSVLLDFTGPSCVNCQKMEKTIFHQADVLKALRDLSPISLNTDPPHDDLAQWEQDHFQTQNRPLYVRIDAQGHEVRWSTVFSPDNAATRARFLAYLAGSGGGDDAGAPASGITFWLLAVFGGLVTLVMPCTYPMIPFTLNVFAKQSQAGRRLLPLATFYAVGIIACFVGLGVLVTGVFHAQLSVLAGHPLTNLVVAGVFVVFGLSLLGAFHLNLPSSWVNAAGGMRSGYAGALLMGLTFAVTAFSCTAPFAGTVLAEAVSTGSWHRAVAGMAVYGLTIALPFFVLALSPGVLTRLPRAGAWMNEFKVVGGLVELAAALKFLAICDLAWHWGVVGRTSCLTAWSACSLLAAAYVLGLWRWEGDERLESIGLPRLAISGAFLALGLYFLSGLCGHDLGTIEAFFPGDPVPA